MVRYDLPSLGDFIELVKRTDEDADHRLVVVREAAPLLYAGARASLDDRERLAAKFERWRFQRLNKYGHCLSADDRLLVDSLDLVVNHLLHGPVRPPKTPRRAIQSAPMPDVESCECAGGPDECGVEAALASDVPLAMITGEAAELTLRHFRSMPGGLRSVRLYAPL